MSELKPCPFCGVDLEERGVVPIFYQHPRNGCFMDDHCVYDEFDAWNRRAALSAPSGWVVAGDSQSQPGYDGERAASVGSEPSAEQALLQQAWGALNFILAFYEPGQRYLDTEAWKNAEAGGKLAHDALSARLGNSPGWWSRK